MNQRLLRTLSVGSLAISLGKPANAVQVNHAHAAWSPRGDLIAFDSNRDGEYHVYVIRPDGTGLRRVTPAGADHSHPAWSPDGRALTFESNRGSDFDIWRIALDGTDLRQLTDGPSSDLVPHWSPDGQFIAFGSERDGNQDVYAVPADGGETVRWTTHPGYDGVPRWAPSGHLAIDTDRGGKREVWLLDPRGADAPRPLVTADEWVHVAAWAADGAALAVTIRLDDDPGDLYRYDVGTGTLLPIASHGGWEGAASWDPTGQRLVFQRRQDDAWVLVILDLDSRSIRNLIPL